MFFAPCPFATKTVFFDENHAITIAETVFFSSLCQIVFGPLSFAASDYSLLSIQKVTRQHIYGMPTGSVIT